jgi:hypothetical protein
VKVLMVAALIRHTPSRQPTTHCSRSLLLQMLLLLLLLVCGHDRCRRCGGSWRRMAKMYHTGGGGSGSRSRRRTRDSVNMMMVVVSRRHNREAAGRGLMGGVEGAGGRGCDHTAGWGWVEWAGRQEDGRAGSGSRLLLLEQLTVLMSSCCWLLAESTPAGHYQRWAAGSAVAQAHRELVGDLHVKNDTSHDF